MKRAVLVAVFLLGFSMMTMAQDDTTPAVEIFGGYSFVQVNPLDLDEEAISFNGWNGSVAFNGNKWAGFVADFGGYYESMEDEECCTNVKIHSFMFGPRITVRKGRVTPFAQALFGAARISVSEECDDGEEIEVTEFTDNDFAISIGGGVDVNITDMIAVRPVQVEYLAIKDASTGNFLKNFRYSGGIVIRLGAR